MVALLEDSLADEKAAPKATEKVFSSVGWMDFLMVALMVLLKVKKGAVMAVVMAIY